MQINKAVLPVIKVQTRFNIVVLSLALTGCVTGCASTATKKTLAARVDALLAPLVAAKEFSGAVVLARRGEFVYQRSFGMANHSVGVAYTSDTPTDGASLAKTFTAAGIWWLVQEGRIELDAPVTRYLPEFPHAQTTVRHLIIHSNGLPAHYEFFDSYFRKDEVRTTEAMLGIVGKHAATPSFTPGSQFEYSNFGFDVAALVIERITGLRYEQFLNERFFAHLNMQTSFARPARLADWPGIRTLGYRWNDATWKLFDVFDMEAFLGASNIYFSAADLSKWASANAAGTALPAAVFAAGQERSLIGGQRSSITGLSWYCNDAGSRCYYTGSLNAFHSFVYWDREREESVVYVSNSSLPPWQTITLQRDLVAALTDRSASAAAPTIFTDIDRGTRSTVSGVYAADGIGEVTVSAIDQRVRVRVGTGLEFNLFQVSDAVFYAPGPDLWLAFSGGQRPSAMHVRSMFVDTIAHRVPQR